MNEPTNSTAWLERDHDSADREDRMERQGRFGEHRLSVGPCKEWCDAERDYFRWMAVYSVIGQMCRSAAFYLAEWKDGPQRECLASDLESVKRRYLHAREQMAQAKRDMERIEKFPKGA